MATLRKGRIFSPDIGTRVQSVAVGNNPSFVGTIVAEFRSFYHVRDDAGRIWHREPSEIKPLIGPMAD
ncbi:hypothetical protein DEM27_10575 [Metarhizobium album]|uniref:Uncharacterized protein n=1 Tax=Metarhizobium album TaxID=2182425 RepID=A0A2U2DU13_9HYPH|nr:hypothetical protein [Rhizobium album]PWE56798.1 hypothetical protein DEM27_10575 [Rhizobium album]